MADDNVPPDDKAAKQERAAAMLCLCLLSTTALADPPDRVTHGPTALPGGWVMEYIQQETGKYSRVGGYPSKATCEAALPAAMQSWRGDNGHCIEWVPQHMEGNPPKLVRGHFIGSQDPEQAGK
jgi:hypothetical protein